MAMILIVIQHGHVIQIIIPALQMVVVHQDEMNGLQVKVIAVLLVAKSIAHDLEIIPSVDAVAVAVARSPLCDHLVGALLMRGVIPHLHIAQIGEAHQGVVLEEALIVVIAEVLEEIHMETEMLEEVLLIDAQHQGAPLGDILLGIIGIIILVQDQNRLL